MKRESRNTVIFEHHGQFKIMLTCTHKKDRKVKCKYNAHTHEHIYASLQERKLTASDPDTPK